MVSVGTTKDNEEIIVQAKKSPHRAVQCQPEGQQETLEAGDNITQGPLYPTYPGLKGVEGVSVFD